MKQIYSAFSGTFYEIPEKDINLLDIGQIVLKSKPSNCKTCMGRGHIGRDINSYAYEICNCIKKKVDFDFLRNLIPNNNAS
jgi:hypothetical protein